MPPPPAPAVGAERPSTAVDPEISARSMQLRALAQELVATERLLTLVTDTPAAFSAAMQAGPTVQQGGWQRSEFSLQSAPVLRSALSGQLTRDQAALLDRLRIDEAAPIHVAAQTLQAHLTKLSGQAFALGGNSEFQGYLRNLTAPHSVAATP